MDPKGKIRYAVVGIGSIAQEAVLPAFAHAENCELSAIVSGDDEKREELGRRYRCRTHPYAEYDECLASRDVDAVYIALPNHLHREYAERAAAAGVHVLCEKPLAPNEKDCRDIMNACRKAGIKLMTAYRLHFEPSNLEAVRLSESGALGDLRVFHSVFCQQVAADNVRLTEPFDKGGGVVFDMGVYCINAARYLFRDEPVEVTAFRGTTGEPRFRTTGEMVSVILRFPQDRLASFTVSFGAAPIGKYTLVGTKGMLSLDPAYEYATERKLTVKIGKEESERTFEKGDQFAPEMIYFADCIQKNREPEPSGEEGLVDVQIVQAIYRSCLSSRPEPISTEPRAVRPEPHQEIYRPPVESEELLHARMPSGEKKKAS